MPLKENALPPNALLAWYRLVEDVDLGGELEEIEVATRKTVAEEMNVFKLILL